MKKVIYSFIVLLLTLLIPLNAFAVQRQTKKVYGMVFVYGSAINEDTFKYLYDEFPEKDGYVAFLGTNENVKITTLINKGEVDRVYIKVPIKNNKSYIRVYFKDTLHMETYELKFYRWTGKYIIFTFSN